MTTVTATTQDPTKGTGFYPSFHALWHLKALCVIQGDPAKFSSKAWNQASGAGDESAVRIVIMDTTVDWEHPNLQGVIDTGKMRDFSGMNAGEAVDPDTGPTIYGAHGTAVAGLIGARPATVKLQLPERAGLLNEGKTVQKDTALPYAGINPFCTIIPISLTAAPDPDMVLAALRYIGQLDPAPQIIVIAAAWDDTSRALQDKQSFDETEGKWSQVNAVLETICENSLVLCAAGNAGAGAMAYPAILAGRFPGLIAVTACDMDANPLTYAYRPRPDQSNIIATLSTQSPRYDSERVFLDPWAEVDSYLKTPEGTTDFPKQRIISLDPRGRRGYNPSIYRYDPPGDGPHLEIASLYAEFSGTSAATAIAAGLISLAMQNEGKSKIDPAKLPGPGTLFDLDAASQLL